MMKCVCLLLPVLALGCGGPAADRDAASPNDGRTSGVAPHRPSQPVDRDAALANLASQVELLRQAVLGEDHTKVADLSLPTLVAMLGGKEKFARRLSAVATEMKGSGVRFASVKVSKQLDFKESSGQLYSIIRQDIELASSNGARINREGYLIGVSADQGTTWRFLDGQGIGSDRSKLELVLPKFPKDLQLPQVR